MSSKTILELKDLSKRFPLKVGIFGSKTSSTVHAVDDVSFSIKLGETMGLVGESGCGKTTLAKLILQLISPTSGKIVLNGQELNPKNFPRKKLSKKIQLVFQDPYSSLNPRMTVYDLIGEVLDIHKMEKGENKKRRILELMELVGLAPFHIYRYPHEFSGGQRQRIVIARALAVKPDIIILDEPVSALDVSVRAQILNLLGELQQQFNLTYLFISHDLSIVRYLCDKVAIMYLGKIVETGITGEVFDNPEHPYSEALLEAVPIPDPTKKKKEIPLLGEVPTPIDPPSYCRFAKRCKYAQNICFEEEPDLIEISPSHEVACFYPNTVGSLGERQISDNIPSNFCMSCGAEVNPSDPFCKSCGHKI